MPYETLGTEQYWKLNPSTLITILGIVFKWCVDPLTLQFLCRKTAQGRVIGDDLIIIRKHWPDSGMDNQESNIIGTIQTHMWALSCQQSGFSNEIKYPKLSKYSKNMIKRQQRRYFSRLTKCQWKYLVCSRGVASFYSQCNSLRIVPCSSGTNVSIFFRPLRHDTEEKDCAIVSHFRLTTAPQPQ